jgi:hypothetical protein
VECFSAGVGLFASNLVYRVIERIRVGRCG